MKFSNSSAPPLQSHSLIAQFSEPLIITFFTASTLKVINKRIGGGGADLSSDFTETLSYSFQLFNLITVFFRFLNVSCILIGGARQRHQLRMAQSIWFDLCVTEPRDYCHRQRKQLNLFVVLLAPHWHYGNKLRVEDWI